MPTNNVMDMRKSAFVFALGLVATACGGSTSDGSIAAEAETTTSAPSNVEVYCELAVRADEVETAIDDKVEASGELPTPAEFEAYVNETMALLDEASLVVDPTIAEPFEVLMQHSAVLAEIFERHDYDVIAVFDEAEATNTDEIDAAKAARNAYDEQICGIVQDEEDESLDDSDAAAGVSTADGSTVGGSTADESTDSEMTAQAGGLTLADAEVAVEIMKTQAGLDVVVDGVLASLPELSREQATCLVKDLTAEQFVAFAGVGPGTDLNDPASADMLELIVLCEIPLEALS